MTLCLVFYIIGLLVTLASCQECKFDAYHACVRSAMEPRRDNNDGPRPQPKGDENPLAQCLKNAGCVVPQPNPDEKAKREQAQKCRKQIHEEIKTKMQNCVKQKVQGFKFPENQGENQRPDREPDHHFGGRGFGFGGPDALEKSCPDEKSRLAARECFRNMFQNKEKNGPPHKEKFQGRQKMCDAKKTCLNQLSQQCQTVRLNVKTAKCDCAKSVFSGQQAADLENRWKNCEPPRPSPATGDENNRGGGPDGAGRFGFGKGKGRQQESFVERSINRFCRDDKCPK